MINEVILELGFERKKNKLYFVDSEANLVEMDSSSKAKTIVAKTNIRKEPGYFYYLNKEGNVGRFKPRNL